MNAQQIEARLRQLDIQIASVGKIEHGWQHRLGCGAVINVYDKGTVLVQGKLRPDCREESLAMLKLALPPETRWCVK
jgi:hypothetical protein